MREPVTVTFSTGPELSVACAGGGVCSCANAALDPTAVNATALTVARNVPRTFFILHYPQTYAALRLAPENPSPRRPPTPKTINALWLMRCRSRIQICTEPLRFISHAICAGCYPESQSAAVLQCARRDEITGQLFLKRRDAVCAAFVRTRTEIRRTSPSHARKRARPHRHGAVMWLRERVNWTASRVETGSTGC